MINTTILHPAVYAYHLPSCRSSQRGRENETITNSSYCSSGYFVEKVSNCGDWGFSNRLMLDAIRVFCGAFPLKGYRRPTPGPIYSTEEMIEDLKNLW